jgi:hypothetical protein
MMGKDVEHWAGNFGARFRSENLKILFKTNNHPERKIAQEESSISPFNFSCDFNYGFGHSYFIKGVK